MGADSKIEWTDNTFNPWIGCTKISAGCKNCYAEVSTFPRRQRSHGLELWGANGTRHVTSDGNWKLPHRWNARAAKSGLRERVFCASLCDVFEDRPELISVRQRLFNLIDQCRNLDWQLLTKRPENIARMAPFIDGIRWPHVWLGCTVEDQAAADARIPHLLRTPAAVRFLSCEPLLAPVNICAVPDSATRPAEFSARYSPLGDLDWVIVGGESGPGARRFDAAWARSIVTQCRAARVPVFVKQMGAHVIDRNDAFDTCANPPDDDSAWPWHDRDPDDIEDNINGFREEYQGAPVRIHLRDRKGGDMSEWPEDLRVREFPKGVR